MEDLTLSLAFAAGLLSFVSPCVLPLVPAYIGYMGGRTVRNVAMESDVKGSAKASAGLAARFGVLLHGLAFVLGFTLVFVTIGLMTTAFVGVVGSSVNVLTEIIGRVGGVIIIIFGLHFMGALRHIFTWLKKRPRLLDSPLITPLVALAASVLILWGFVSLVIALPILAVLFLLLFLGGAFTRPGEFWTNALDRIEIMLYSDTRRDVEPSKNKGLSGSFLMGVIFSAGWTPCIGPLLGTILTVAAQTGDVGIAVPMLTAYSLGLGIPFLLTAGLLEGAQSILRRLQQYMGAIELVSGLLLVVIGLAVASGTLQNLSQNLTGEQVDFSIRIEECGLSLVQGHLTFSQAGECMNGNLHPISLNQSAAGVLNAEHEALEYVFTVDEALLVDIELNRVEEVLPLLITITDRDGNEIARSGDWTRIDENEFTVIDNLQLPESGQYTVTVTQDGETDLEEIEFRVRVAEEEEDVLTEVGTIEGLAEESDAPIGLEIGNRAPDFTVTTVDGEEVSLSDLRGQVVLLNFWGTWCGPCRREMPDFQAVFEERADEGFTILALAVRDTQEAVLDFRDEFGLTFPLALDEGSDVTDRYAIASQPSTLILDEQGVIVFKHFGLVLEEQILDVLDEQLES